MAARSGPAGNVAKMLRAIAAGLESGAISLELHNVDVGAGGLTTLVLSLTGPSLQAITKTLAEREQRRLRVSTNPKVRR